MKKILCSSSGLCHLISVSTHTSNTGFTASPLAECLEKMSERNFKSRYIVNKCIAGDHVIVYCSYDLK